MTESMDASKTKLLVALCPKLPLILRVVIMHVLGLSEPAKYVDLRSELTVSILRSLLNPSRPPSISATQRLTLRDPGVKGRIWVSTYVSPPPPEVSIRDVLADAIATMRSPKLPCTVVRMPELSHVEAEWTGYRAGAATEDSLPDLSENAKYREMIKECQGPTTILYLHGGAFFLGDPASHRPSTQKLAKLAGGRCFSVRYRLAPQHPFPAALLDALTSYFTLLFPPPDAYHEPVQPEHIVIAGDSAGGNLSLALVQLILELRRKNVLVSWYGEQRQVPLPAGVACNSPWLDITHSSPSFDGDNPDTFDYLPKPRKTKKANLPACDIWPSKPPRQYLYVDDELATHPLVSVIMNDSWKGAPPIYICTGWEMLAYENKFLAQKLMKDGVKVVFVEYEAMPHCFAMLMTEAPNARHCFVGWASFIRAAAEDASNIESSAVTVKSRTTEEVPFHFDGFGEATHREIRDRVIATAAAGLSPEAIAKL